MIAIGFEESQGFFQRPAGIHPAFTPLPLRERPIPVEGKLSFLATQCNLDTHLPDIIPVSDMMDDLPYCPTTIDRECIQVIGA
jgi:hypothetical protein